MVHFHFICSNRPIVLAEQDTAQVAPSNSPTKVYAALKVATPQSRGLAAEVGTPNEPPLQIDEGITTETHSNPSPLKIPGPASDAVQSQVKDLSNKTVVAPTPDTTPVKSMDDNLMPTAIPATSSQEELTMHTDPGTTHQETGQNVPLARGKRRRAKYSLTGGMLKKHPVLKFSATGPLDKSKSPHK